VTHSEDVENDIAGQEEGRDEDEDGVGGGRMQS
jgi:hypothetical protein